MRDLAEKLANIEDIEKWGKEVNGLSSRDMKIVFGEAEQLWIQRKIKDGTLLLHPDARAELIERNYKPRAIHRRMVLANVLVNYNGSDSKERFRRIKEKIIRKHSDRYWFDVYKRIKPTYAAKERIIKHKLNTSPMLSYAASQSIVFNNFVNHEINQALLGNLRLSQFIRRFKPKATI
ncbi:hypothetical protein [Marinomonas sp. S3726]|uniref:hypothetical protein n=1 Tax=Marinomonas sp. S3726 TaxID=579484 RepID=UPI0005FA3C87|nr:hypothetical protein [Marinomonas sp. S3726]